EALYIVKKDRPDLVLLDIRMPGIDGIETLRQIKKVDQNIAVIMLSAHGTLKTSIEAARLGAYDSIAKPFDLEEMKLVIKDSLVSKATGKEPHLVSKKKKIRQVKR
ncbi:MAG: response regulator, partial [Candidatus Omnitrophica bacterium]|nr:response regulator [Candidatus Omnitrophota bacterium]